MDPAGIASHTPVFSVVTVNKCKHPQTTMGWICGLCMMQAFFFNFILILVVQPFICHCTLSHLWGCTLALLDCIPKVTRECNNSRYVPLEALREVL